MEAFKDGCALSESMAAFAKNGMNESLTPSRAKNSAFAALRSREMFVTSTSTTVVSWAEVCSDSTIRLAITLRSLVIGSVLPRNGLGWEAGAPVDAGGDEGADAAGAASAGAGACAFLAASSTSCLRIRPPTPVPVTD